MRTIASFSLAAVVSGLLPVVGFAAGGTSYTVDPVHSAVLFRIKHLNVSHCHGRFNDISGTVTFDPASPEASSFAVKLDADSVDTNNAKRDKHLKSPDFFNAKEFKTINFTSSKVKKTGDNKLEVMGELTLHGVTKPLTATFDLVGSSEGGEHGRRVGFDTEFIIKRSEFGITSYLDTLSDEVRISVSLEAIEGEGPEGGKKDREKQGR